MARSNREIVGLQYLRGIAALGVVVDHASGMTALPKYFGHEMFQGSLEKGAVGVDLFFVISGFIISIVSLDRNLAPKISAKEFFLRRFIRIVPLMWCAIISYGVLKSLGRGGFDVVPYIRALFLIPFGTVQPDVIWTLRHEFIFYVLFAVTFLRSANIRIIMLLWAISPIIYASILPPIHEATPALEALRIFTYPVNVEFGAGLLLGMFWLKYPKANIRLPIHPLFVFVGLFVLLVILAISINLVFVDVRKTAISAIVCIAILYLGVRAECPPGVLNGIGLILGEASYAIYLFHLHIISAVLGVASALMPTAPVEVVIPVIVAIAVCSGVLLHIGVERPLLSFLAKTIRTRPVSPVTPG